MIDDHRIIMQKRNVRDTGSFEENVQVVRYKGSKIIKGMIERDQYIEAFTHAQLGIEKILWDKIVGIFENEKAMIVRRTIENSKKGQDKRRTTTYELIKWAHFLGAIDDNEFSHLADFNGKRNKIMHSHGKWWNMKDYKEALQKGVRFLERNSL